MDKSGKYAGVSGADDVLKQAQSLQKKFLNKPEIYTDLSYCTWEQHAEACEPELNELFRSAKQFMNELAEVNKSFDLSGKTGIKEHEFSPELRQAV